MFIGQISQRQFCAALSPKLQTLISEVIQRVATPLATGKYELQGDTAFFLVMEDHTQPLAQRRSECHARYLDVQIVLQGRERFGYSLAPFNGLDDDQLASRDLAFSEQLAEERFVDLMAGDFIVFYPGQPHRPLIAVEGEGEPVRKVVIKVDKAFFE
ncbi:MULTISPECIES: YhcH/YjgK/YiaL family protein [Vibrio]|uniref:YhcH/YjgK/YiaL family protein n=1 Tax=Vibrio chanodichtyis TaxID=3027932 RepID=A0ABT5UX56_9VIBR|nr:MULTISPECIES: YhcH/YjgK/YiaL family protein [Vibrio]MDE1513798.1 YhcH/YjgK/YiaL family protein [Vibrio chanodichtyis]